MGQEQVEIIEITGQQAGRDQLSVSTPLREARP